MSPILSASTYLSSEIIVIALRASFAHTNHGVSLPVVVME